MNFHPSLKTFANSYGFSSAISLYLASSRFPFIQTCFLVTVEEKKIIYIAYGAVTTMFYGVDGVAQGEVRG